MSEPHFGIGFSRPADEPVPVLLKPEAQAESTPVLSRARPGIDGIYRIAGVTHRCGRGSGSETVCDIAQPQGGAGKDSRVPANGSVPVSMPAPR